MARTQTISSSVKPASALSRSVRRGRNIGGRSRTPLLPVRTQRAKFVRSLIGGLFVDVRVAPGIAGNRAALDVGSIPFGYAADWTHLRDLSFRPRRKPSGFEVKQIERAAEALD